VTGFKKSKDIYPYFISIETTNFCNLHCPECPVGINKTSKAEKSTFDYALYQKLINELKPTLLHVILYFQGEPFLNNQLYDLIKYTHDSRIFSSTSTNGQFLNDMTAKKIVLSGLDKLIVSIDGSTQETYETYRVGGNLQKAIDGIKHIIKWKKGLKSITPMVEIQFLVLKTNEHQMKEMQKLARSLHADRLTFKTAQLYDFENGSELLTTKGRYARYKKGKDGKFKIKARQLNHCWRLWSGAVINAHGDVLPCCFDKASEHPFGNINDSSFYNCWQSNKASDFRSKILDNRKQFDICRNCTNN
jgi:radical SAM protein with 4Fe4S-binding SPASM domain